MAGVLLGKIGAKLGPRLLEAAKKKAKIAAQDAAKNVKQKASKLAQDAAKDLKEKASKLAQDAAKDLKEKTSDLANNAKINDKQLLEDQKSGLENVKNKYQNEDHGDHGESSEGQLQDAQSGTIENPKEVLGMSGMSGMSDKLLGVTNKLGITNKLKDSFSKSSFSKSSFSGMRGAGGAGGARLQAIVLAVKAIRVLLVSLIVIFIICLIVYVLYLCFTGSYVRRFALGHTEPLQMYMTSYFKDFFAFAKEVRDDTQSKTAIQSFVTAYNELLAFLNITNVSSEEPTEKSSIPSSTFNLNQNTFEVDDIPYFYLMFMFYDAIDDNEVHELSLMDKFIQREFVSKFYLPTQTSIGDISPLAKLKASFDNMRQTIQTESKSLQEQETIDKPPENARSIVAIYMLDLMLNGYLDDIKLGYDMRKSGGRSWILFKIYMNEYSKFLREELGRIWSPFLDDVKGLGDAFQEFLVSDTVREFVQNIPLKIAGVETFVAPNQVSSLESNERWWSRLNPLNTFLQNRQNRRNKKQNDQTKQTKDENTPQNKPDVIEHMGIGGFFSAIGKIFPALLKILMSVVNVINDPMLFIRWILGLVIGFTLYILYALICVLSFLFYIPAFFIIIIINAVFSAFWILLYLAIAVFYLVLTIIDSVTGGNILPLFRCENLPNAWTRYPNYVRDNKYVRNLFCRYKCGNRYSPSTNGWMCNKIATSEPMYAPHQLIYNAYMEHYDPLKQVPFRYSYTPTLQYFKQTLDQRTSLWRSVYRDTQEYMTLCAEKMKPYDHIIKEMCLYLTKSDKFEKEHATERQQIAELCKITYCINADKNKFDYCSTKDSDFESKLDKNIIYKIIVQSLALVILVLIVISMRKLAIMNAQG